MMSPAMIDIAREEAREEIRNELGAGLSGYTRAMARDTAAGKPDDALRMSIFRDEYAAAIAKVGT